MCVSKTNLHLVKAMMKPKRKKKQNRRDKYKSLMKMARRKSEKILPQTY